jgi:hypothetical protein
VEDYGKEYAKMVLRREVEDFITKLNDYEWRKETEEAWDDGQNKASLAYEMLKMHTAEILVYARLADIQGSMVPRHLGASELDITPEEFTFSEGQRQFFKVRGDSVGVYSWIHSLRDSRQC